MRNKILYILSGLAIALLVWNLHNIFLKLPDEASQGAIWRIFTFHVPGAFVGSACAFTAFVASIVYLARRDLRADALAVAVTEAGLAFGAINLITGMIWARIIWGIWWTWDARLTSMLVVWLMYAGYLMLRRAIEEPVERARNAAVLNVFIFPGVYITWKSIEWWRTQHPSPVLSVRDGGGMAPGMEAAMWWNFLALLLVAVVLVAIRLRQESRQREIDGIRRAAHAV
ncbi:MAG: cytochrome c biogenesis protein CcsA [Bryobacteraceae bacterium]